jgi:hypothetical protein
MQRSDKLRRSVKNSDRLIVKIAALGYVDLRKINQVGECSAPKNYDGV